MPKKATATRKIKNTKAIIQKLKNVMKDNWGVKKTQKKKRNQLAKMIIAQREKELDKLKEEKGIVFKNESNVRFFKKNNNFTAANNEKEATALETKEKIGRYTASKTRTRKVIKNEEEMKKYLNATAKRGAQTRAILERRWKAQNNAEEERERFEKYMEMLRKQMEKAREGKK
jgi:hypothetical protein